jgi:hypothetical protein
LLCGVAHTIRRGALLNGIQRVYPKTLPLALAQIDESQSPFYSTDGKVKPKKHVKSNIVVETNYLDGQIDADFRVILDEVRSFMIRLEINFRRIKLNLYPTKSQIERMVQRCDLTVAEITGKELTRRVLEKIGHSVSGASFPRQSGLCRASRSRTISQGTPSTTR